MLQARQGSCLSQGWEDARVKALQLLEACPCRQAMQSRADVRGPGGQLRELCRADALGKAW
jgi:hypothetical protein